MRLTWLTGVAACLAVQGCAPYPGGYYGASQAYGPGVAIEAEPAYAQPGYPGPAYVEPGPGYYGYGGPSVFLGGRDRFEQDRGRDRERFERERFERERFRERSERERQRPAYQPQPSYQPRQQPAYQPQPPIQQRPQPAFQPQPRAPQPSPRQILPGTPPGQAYFPPNGDAGRSSP